MSRIPIRLRLTIAFAASMAVVLVLVGAFVYARVAGDLSSSIDDALRTRADDLAHQLQQTSPGAVGISGERSEGAEDILSEVVRLDGRVVTSSDSLNGGSVLTPEQLRTASQELTYFEPSVVPGIENEARLLARPVSTPDGRFVVVVGTSTGDRAETLSGLIATFAIGGPLALALASALGYAVAALAMRPVEAMRARAGRITLGHSEERLPVPAADDEIGRLAKTLNEMLERIEESLARERAFVADASHELRTPLAILRGELELGLRNRGEPGAAKAAMTSALEEAVSLQQLADDLLALARTDSGTIELRYEAVDVRQLLDQTRVRYIARAEASARTIDVQAPAGMHWNLDAERARSALGNLVDNALRYGAGTIRISANEAGGDLRLTIADEGAGFPADFAPKAFERFSRAETGRTSVGTGLGLAIVAAIARAHGGHATVGSTESGGAAVSLTLPPGPERA
jgi:signal transduction histidine kinase